MHYKESIKYLLRFADYERLSRSGVVWDTGRIEKLLTRLSDPHLSARTVHIAGTKGKGSTAAMIASVMKEAGYKVGLFTSPHLLSYTERIRVAGVPISEADWIKLVASVRPHVEAVNREGACGELTTFEIFTAMAFKYFRDVGVEYQVVEVGLGGRLDATNVVRPRVAVITSVSYDHMEVLGDTLAKIATEKAGIIKPGCAVVSAPQFSEAMEVIEHVCRERGAWGGRVGKDVTWRGGSFDENGQSLRVKGLAGQYDLKIPLSGEHQAENAAVAVAAVEVLAERDEKITPMAISQGLAKVDWLGRLQVLRRKPWVVIDGAHNVHSMQKLGEALKKHFHYARLILILGFSVDKDVTGMAVEAAKMADGIIVTVSRNPRSVKTAVLREDFAKRGVEVREAAGVAAALKLALDTAAPDDLICATGSIFVVAEVLEEYL